LSTTTKRSGGHAEEFLALFKKNHYPVLKKEIELGRTAQGEHDCSALSHHGRWPWDYRVTIVFKNAAIAKRQF